MGMVTDIKPYLNFDSVRKNIVYRLINTKRNADLLEDIPHMEFLDLSIVFHCMVSQEETRYAAIRVHNLHMKLWDISVEELYQAAKKNTPQLLPYQLKSMAEVLRELEETENPEEYDYDRCMAELADSGPMYVLSNKSVVEGAACMLYPDIMRDISDTIDSSFFMIPSSVHELLILPAETLEGWEKVKNMLKEINDTQVEPEEILSYSLYYYDREEGKISIY